MSSITAEAPLVFSKRIPLIVAAAFFMETLDGTIVTTALPAIATNLHRTALALTPSISLYLVAVAVFVPTAGWASDRFGSKKLFAAAVGVFTLASLLCALSPSAEFLFGARTAQGVAAAFMSPVGRLVVLRQAPKQYLIEAIAIITWPALIGPVVGPPLAGLITTYTSWRWIFLLNLPIGLMGVWLVWRWVPNHQDEAARPFDMPGFLLTAASLALLVEGLSSATQQGPHLTAALAAIAVGVLLAVISVLHALRHPTPLLDLRAVRVLTYSISTVTSGMLSRIAISATPFLLPLFFEIGFGMNPLDAGMMLLVYMLGNLGMKSLTTRVLRSFGFRRTFLLNGYACAMTIAACGALAPDVNHVLAYVVLLLAGATRSLHFTTVNTLAFADISAAQRTGASTLAAMTQQLGFTLGVTFGALALGVSQRWPVAHALVMPDFRHAFVVAALLMAVATTWALRLPPGAGVEVAGRA